MLLELRKNRTYKKVFNKLTKTNNISCLYRFLIGFVYDSALFYKAFRGFHGHAYSLSWEFIALLYTVFGFQVFVESHRFSFCRGFSGGCLSFIDQFFWVHHVLDT